MLLLEFTEEQEQLRQTLRDFGRREIEPMRRELEHDLAAWKALFRRCAELGLLEILDLRDPTKNDGRHVTVGVAAEELSRYDLGLATAVSGAGARAGILSAVWGEDLREELISRFSHGDLFLGMGLTEPDAGSDVTRMRAVAKRGKGGVWLSGEKSSVSGISTADAVVVFAHEEDQPPRRFSAFVVPVDYKGVSVGAYNDLGWQPKGRGWMALDHVWVPDAHRVGEPGMGLHLILNAFDYNRGVLALICVGATVASLDDTVQFAKDRTTFGKPLASRQAISFDIVDGFTKMDAARYMSYRVLALRDQGKPHTRESAMAKYWVPKVCVEVLHRCLTIHGHMGYTDEVPVQRRLRDVIGFEIGDGTAEMMKLILARELFGREVVE